MLPLLYIRTLHHVHILILINPNKRKLEHCLVTLKWWDYFWGIYDHSSYINFTCDDCPQNSLSKFLDINKWPCSSSTIVPTVTNPPIGTVSYPVAIGGSILQKVEVSKPNVFLQANVMFSGAYPRLPLSLVCVKTGMFMPIQFCTFRWVPALHRHLEAELIIIHSKLL